MSKTFNPIIIGVGQVAPLWLAGFKDAGKTVALIERDELGGKCVNKGCTPTKALVNTTGIRRSKMFITKTRNV